MFDKNDTLKVKGIGIICLLFHHLFLSEQRIINNNIQLEFLSVSQLQSMAVGARICVWIFAFLSAYGLTCQYIKQKDKNVSRYVAKRWISLMQSFWFIYPVMFVLSFVLFRNPLEVYTGKGLYVVLDFLGIADLFGTPMLSSVWWYMCFAQVVLFMFPILYKFCEALGAASLPAVFILLQFIEEGIHSDFGGYYTNYLFVVVLAIVCAQKNFFEKSAIKSSKHLACVLEGIGLVLITIGFVYLRVKFAGSDQWKITTIYYSVAVLLLCVFVNKYLRWKPI